MPLHTQVLRNGEPLKLPWGDYHQGSEEQLQVSTSLQVQIALLSGVLIGGGISAVTTWLCLSFLKPRPRRQRKEYDTE
jgi:hypothetical protein